MPQILNIRFLRFLAVGLLNSVFGYGCFALFLYSGMHYAAALFLATLIGILFNFKTTGRWVFQSRDNRLVLRFFATYAVVYIVNAVGMKALAMFGLHPYYGGAALLLPIAGLAYCLNRRFVFTND